jgi:hypothetical protein
MHPPLSKSGEVSMKMDRDLCDDLKKRGIQTNSHPSKEGKEEGVTEMV